MQKIILRSKSLIRNDQIKNREFFFPDFHELVASVTTIVIHLLQIWCQSQKPPSDDQMHFENPTSKPLKYAYVPQYKYT